MLDRGYANLEEGELGAIAPRPGGQQQITTVRTSKRNWDPVGTSLYDAVGKMRDPSSLDHPAALQLDRLGS
jgi:hypothetical protein